MEFAHRPRGFIIIIISRRAAVEDSFHQMHNDRNWMTCHVSVHFKNGGYVTSRSRSHIAAIV